MRGRIGLLAGLLLACPDKDDAPADTDPPADTDTDAVPDTDPRADTTPAVDTVDTNDTGEPDPALAASTMGTRFVAGFMENLFLLANGEPRFAVVLWSPVATTGRLRVGTTGWSSFDVPANEAVEVPIPSGIHYEAGSGVIGAHAVVVETQTPVQAWAVHYRVYFSDATALLPFDELGDDHLVVATRDNLQYSPSSLLVVPTVADTTVTITPTVDTVDGLEAGVATSWTLQTGQTLQLQASTDLSGTRIASSAPVAVFAGARQGTVGDCSADSHMMDQVLPVSRLGTEYAVVPFSGQGGDVLKIVALENDTEVRLDCGDPFYLDASEVWTGRVTAATRITTDRLVAVGQLNESQECNPSQVGDPSFLVLPPLALWREEVGFLSLVADDIFQARSRPGVPNTQVHFLNAVVETGADLLLDGVDRASEATPLSVTRYAAAQILLEEGPHTLSSTGRLQGHAYGFSDYDAYTVGLGWDCTGCLRDLDLPTRCPNPVP